MRSGSSLPFVSVLRQLFPEARFVLQYRDGPDCAMSMSRHVSGQYAGILPLTPDGVVHQVTWSVGPAGPTTEVSTADPGPAPVRSERDARQSYRSRGRRLSR